MEIVSSNSAFGAIKREVDYVVGNVNRDQAPVSSEVAMKNN